MWALELLEQCENFFGIIFLQFVGCLLDDSMVGLSLLCAGFLWLWCAGGGGVTLSGCARACPSCGLSSQGVASLVAGRGLSAHGLQQLYPAGSIVVAHELSSSMACGIFVHWQANS